MSVGFSSALDDLQRRLAGSETHAAMVVTLDFDGAPLMWFLDRRGKAHPATAYTKPAGSAVTPSGGGITVNDLNDMIAYVAQFRSAMYTVQTPAGCHATALATKKGAVVREPGFDIGAVAEFPNGWCADVELGANPYSKRLRLKYRSRVSDNWSTRQHHNTWRQALARAESGGDA